MFHIFTLRTPFKILPPATPPFNSSTSQPGLFTSKDRITEIKQSMILVILTIKSFPNIHIFATNIPISFATHKKLIHYATKSMISLPQISPYFCHEHSRVLYKMCSENKSGSGCSKLTMLLVNVSLKFQTLKNVEDFY